jgi:glycosyltransferase involved in cell wall biosynthesis
MYHPKSYKHPSKLHKTKVLIARMLPKRLLSMIRISKRLFSLKIQSVLGRKAILFIDSRQLGGGSIFLSMKLERELSRERTVLILDHITDTKFNLIYKSITIHEIDFSHRQQFFACLKKYSVSLIFFNQLATLKKDEIEKIFSMAVQSQIPCDFIIHDYFCLCPSIKMAHTDFYKNSDCAHNASCPYSATIHEWRRMFLEGFEKMRNIYVFSESTKKIIEEAFPTIHTELISVGSLSELQSVFSEQDVQNIKGTPDKPMTLGVMGLITREKGLDIIEEIARMIIATGYAIQIKIFGSTERPLQEDVRKVIELVGTYKYDTVDEFIEGHNLSFFIFPSIWPETGSFVCDEILQMGFPILTFDLGAQYERINSGEYGWAVPLTSGAKGMFEIVEKNYTDTGRILDKANRIKDNYRRQNSLKQSELKQIIPMIIHY